MQLTHAQEAELRTAMVAAFPGIGGVTQLAMALQEVDIDIAWAGGLFTNIVFAVDSVIVQENARGKIENVIGAVRRANPGNARLAELETTWLKTSAVGDPAPAGSHGPERPQLCAGRGLGNAIERFLPPGLPGRT